VVAHEAASAGLPLILSDAVGSSDQFLIDQRNGWRVRAGNVAQLMNALIDAAGLKHDERDAMGEQSYLLSRSCSPAASASALLQALGR
jgi:glycosyltransferase involved in cell wall biosynthesis